MGAVTVHMVIRMFQVGNARKTDSRRTKNLLALWIGEAISERAIATPLSCSPTVQGGTHAHSISYYFALYGWCILKFVLLD